MIERGRIYDYDFGARDDHRQAGRRPALVVQSNLLHEIEGYGLTIILPLTTRGRSSPTYVRVEPTPDNGLTEVSYIKCEQPMTVASDRLVGPRGYLDKEALYLVGEALKLVLGLP